MVALSVLYPSYIFVFQMLIGLDLSSHWLSMTATHATGQSSHKAIDLSKNVFLKLYYTSRPVLFSVCAANECAAAADSNSHRLCTGDYVCPPWFSCTWSVRWRAWGTHMQVDVDDAIPRPFPWWLQRHLG